MRRNSAGSGGTMSQGCSQQRASAKPAARRRSSVSSGAGVVPRFAEALEVGRVGLAGGDLGAAPLQPRDVAGAAVLGGEPPAGPQRPVQAAEERVVVEHPVEDGAGEDDVDRLLELELGQVGDQSLVPGPQHRAHLLDHRGRAVDGDDAARGQALDQHRGDPAAAAARVEDALLAAELEAVEDRPRPLLVGDGDALVGGGVPVAGRRSSAPAHPVKTAPSSAGRSRLRPRPRRRRSRPRSRA